MGLIRVNDVGTPLANQFADLQCSRKAPPPRFGNMHSRPGILGARFERRIADRYQFRSVAAFAQALQKQQSLMLPSAIVAAQVNNERAHAQASPGLGQDLWASFSPARSRPSLRYLR